MALGALVAAPLHSAMAMAMSTVQASSSVSPLTRSSIISSSVRHDEAASSGTSSKCSRNGFLISTSDSSTLSRSRRNSHSRLLRSSPRSSTQSSQDCGELCGGETALCESERQLCEERCGFESSIWSRRECFLAMAMAGALVSQEYARAEETESVVDAPTAPTLELYVDEKEGFKLLRPALWNKVKESETHFARVMAARSFALSKWHGTLVEKAGATVLFEDPSKRGNTIGVVVNPVRIASLKDFGTPDVVAEKLLAAERKKPSTNDAQLVRVQERLANGDTPLYSLEYTLDSSRGQKKILSAVTVASKKLYILNITYVDSAAAPAPPAMAKAYEQVLNSFDLVV